MVLLKVVAWLYSGGVRALRHAAAAHTTGSPRRVCALLLITTLAALTTRMAMTEQPDHAAAADGTTRTLPSRLVHSLTDLTTDMRGEGG
jgi:hypothetical protein